MALDRADHLGGAELVQRAVGDDERLVGERGGEASLRGAHPRLQRVTSASPSRSAIVTVS